MRCFAHAQDYCKMERGERLPMVKAALLRTAAEELGIEWNAKMDDALASLSHEGRACLLSGMSREYTLSLAFPTFMVEEYMRKVILDLYGQKGLRIWGVLKDKHLLEERDVAKCVLVSEKEARVTLLHMLRDDMLVMQEVPKTADAAVLRTYYLFGVDETRAFRAVHLRACKMLQNHLCRLYQVHLDAGRLEEKATTTNSNEDKAAAQMARNNYQQLKGQTLLILDDIILLESPLHQKLVQMKPERPKRGVKAKRKPKDDDGDE